MKKYDWVGKYKNGFARVKLDGKYGFIDENVNEICPLKYSWVGYFYNGFAIVKLDRKYGFIDENGNEICSLKYDGVGNFQNGFARVRLDKKYGYINENGNEVCDIIYDQVWGGVKDGLATVKLHGTIFTITLKEKHKDKKNKLDYTLLDWNVISQLVRVREYGVKKYDGRDTWKNVDKTDYIAAIFSHLIKYINNEKIDDETNCIDG